MEPENKGECQKKPVIAYSCPLTGSQPAIFLSSAGSWFASCYFFFHCLFPVTENVAFLICKVS